MNEPTHETGGCAADACSAEFALADAMQDVWNDRCADAGVIPDALEVRGPRTTVIYADFHDSAFVQDIVALLKSRGFVIQQNSGEQPPAV